MKVYIENGIYQIKKIIISDKEIPNKKYCYIKKNITEFNELLEFLYLNLIKKVIGEVIIIRYIKDKCYIIDISKELPEYFI